MCWSTSLWCKWALNHVWKPCHFVHIIFGSPSPNWPLGLDIGSLHNKEGRDSFTPPWTIWLWTLWLTVSKHQPSWNMFLMFFSGRQQDICSFSIVFREMLLVPVSAGTLKKWYISKTHEKLLLWWGGDWSLNEIGDILRSRYALIENIPLILAVKHHFCYGAAAKHKVKLP